MFCTLFRPVFCIRTCSALSENGVVIVVAAAEEIKMLEEYGINIPADACLLATGRI